MNKLKQNRIRAVDGLCEAYEALVMVEKQLTDKEARSLIDIAQAIVTIEEILGWNEEQ
jgi:hypothetical protein